MNQPFIRTLSAPVARLWAMAAALVVANAVIAPDLMHGARVNSMANLLAPLALAALAGVPSVLSGGGGLDLSVGPALGFVNVVTVGVLAEHGILSAWQGIPLCVLLGALVGAVNGLLVAYGRLQPIVATLGTFLVLSGLALVVLPQPRGGAPRWASFLADGSLGGYLPHILILPTGALVLWVGLRRLGLVRLITAVGSDQRAAHASGVHVPVVRLCAYTLGGAFAGLAGIALTALTDSADPTVGKQYTLMAIAAVALGGNALAGGRGGMLGPLLGAVVLFLIQLLLSSAQVSSLWIQVVYGVILLAALCLNSAPRSKRRPRVTAAQGV